MENKIELDSYKTYTKEFIENAHDFVPFQLDITNQDVKELPNHHVPEIKNLQFDPRLILKHNEQHHINPTL